MIKSLSSKVWAALSAAFFLAVALFSAYRKGGNAKANEIKAQTEEAAREYEKAGSEALIGGLSREQDKSNETIDTVKRNHFE